MKKLFLSFIFLFTYLFCFAQYFAQVTKVNLANELSPIYKNTIAIEVGQYITDVDARIQLYTSFSYIRATPEKDSYLGYGILGSGSFAEFIPTVVKYNSLDVGTLNFGSNYKIFDSPFTPIAGAEGALYIGSFTVESTGGLINGTRTGRLRGFSLRPIVGLIYSHKDLFQLQIDTGKTFTAPIRTINFNYWQSSLTFTFFL